MPPPLKNRPYWNDLLARCEKLVAAGFSNVEVTEAIAEEFGLPEQSFRIAIRRGDIPSMESRDRARALARKQGDVHFLGKPCVTCGSRTRYVADYRCVPCSLAYDREQAAKGTGG